MSMPSKILVVDDEPNVRLMMRTVLELAGFAVAEAEDGGQALRGRRAIEPDLILLDLRMPGMDGLATLQRLRDEGNETAVVIMSAHGSVADAVAAMKLGAIDFLSKPLTPYMLRKVVADVLARHAVSPSETAARTLVAEQLERAKCALNRRAFGEADTLLRQAVGLDPNLAEAHHLLDLLQECKQSEQHPYRGLRDWLPVGRLHGRT